MSLQNGFKFRSIFYDEKMIGTMNYDEVSFLIEQVSEEIQKSGEYIYPYSKQLKNREEVPEQITKKLHYKDALIYFSRDLKEILNKKKMNIEKAFFKVAQEKLEENVFNEIFGEVEKLIIGE